MQRFVFLTMFNFFKPQCPVDDMTKKWVEYRLTWLISQFGYELFTREILLPTKEYFPEPFDGSESSVRNLLTHVCRYMIVDATRVELRLFTNPEQLFLVNEGGRYIPTGAAGLYEERSDSAIIHSERSELSNLSNLIGTMAHELSHLRLMGEGRVSGNDYDNELLTDLTAVFHGFGIFLGNSPRNWDGAYKTWPGTKHRPPVAD